MCWPSGASLELERARWPCSVNSYVQSSEKRTSLTMLGAWEVDIDRYEASSGGAVGADVRIATVINGLEPGKLKDHLQLKSDIDTHEELLSEIKNYHMATTAWRSKTDGASPMEIGAFDRYGRGKPQKRNTCGKEHKGQCWHKDSKGGKG